MSRLVGQTVTRVEDPRILTGQGRYVDDLRLPGLLHVTFVRSPFPHAAIRSIDTAAASAVPGVVAVLTAADLEGVVAPIVVMGPEGFHGPTFGPLAADTVRFVGDPVAVVIAESRHRAEDGADAVEVDWEPLDAVASTAAALAPGAPQLFPDVAGNVVYRDSQTYGDPDGAFARADLVVEETFHQHRHANVPMECHGGVASFSPSTGDLVYHASHQGPHGLRFGLAMSLGLPFHRVQVRCGDVGGAFGQKGYVQREDLVVCAASMRLGRPVKWIADRYENLVAGGQAREESMHVQAAVLRDGTLLGLRVHLVLDHGSYPGIPVPASVYTASVVVLLPSAYRIVDYACETTVAATNKAPYVAYRGPWEMETWVRERLLDVIADRVGLEPTEVRAKNLWAPEDYPRDLVTGPTLRDITVGECHRRVVEALDLSAFRAEQAQARADGRLLGVGTALYIEPAPGPANWGPSIGFTLPDEPARARLEPDGRLTVFTQQMPHGQGHETTFAQVAADALGVPLDHVRIVAGDTNVTPFSLMGTGGSRAAHMATGAVTGAVTEVRRRVADLAAALLEANADDIEIADGAASVKGVPARSVPLAQIALTAYAMPAMFPPGTDTSLEAHHSHVNEHGGWAQAAHGCVVEVDPGTGLVRILRYVVVEDCGRIINPAIVEGQVRGGVAQGIGAVLLERSGYTAEGQPQAVTFMDYLLPTAVDIPELEIHHLETPGLDELDFRGVGEGGAVASPATLTNAIEDALRPFGAAVREQHLPPYRILELCGTLEVDGG
jgi:aerobic carbon-monoxide dehydrogenase large subunit